VLWRWLIKQLTNLGQLESGQHTFKSAISLREDDGRLGACRCTKCGYCIYPENDDQDPPCVPRAHEWVPVKVFQWKHVALADKLPQPLQCALCGAHALTLDDWERFGCPGYRKEDP
jgi:hypothetical protein